MNPVEWGWRIRCCTLGCSRKVEGWSADGTPPLPPSGVFTSGPLSGWFFQYLDGRRYLPASSRRGHVAFCPEHASVATAWLARFTAWEASRSAVGKEVSLGLLDRLAELLAPAEKRARQKRAAGEAARQWEKSNPPPAPPWRAS